MRKGNELKCLITTDLLSVVWKKKLYNVGEMFIGGGTA
jgi:hypothetical protein